MEKLIEISKGVLRDIKENKDFFEKYFMPCKKNEKIKWFLSCLCEESDYLNSNKSYSFQEEIMILSDLIGNFKHQNRFPVPVEKLYALDNIFILKLVKMLIKKEAYFDTHISVRPDLVFFDSVHTLIPYEKYKELVFTTICRTTSCSRGNFNPMEKVKNKVWLKDEDYKELCAEIFS
jgi:hypothetical protein